MSDLTKVPAASAPDGYKANFDDPETRHREAGMIISVVGMVLSTAFILLRVYTKTYLARLWGIDDVAMIVAWMISIALQTMVIYLWAVRFISVHLWDLYIPEANLAILLISICSVIYIPLMALAKFSLLLFYRRLSPEAWFKWMLWTTVIFVIGYSAALFFALIFACTPLQVNWDITITSGTCANKGGMYLATAGLNAATDVLLLVIPIPMVLKLHVPLSQKIGLVAMFSVGSLTLVTSLVRLSLLPPMITAVDATWAIAKPAMWICVEANLVIICGCLPIMRLFFRHVAPRWIGEFSGPRAGSGQDPAGLSVAELSNLDRTRRSVKDYETLGRRVNEWEEWWEKDMAIDDGSQEYIVDVTGKIVPAKRSNEKSVRTQKSDLTCKTTRTDLSGPESVIHERPPAPTPYSQLNNFGFPCSETERSPPRTPNFQLGRNLDGRLSLRPHAI
ncbi:hypothetical protein Slin15195_G029750 [Septoria linicola]|uniref:Rhodopsin domain-containing protein n=1 Tax=Septoria linicola TaxID=215465 RepID=A0A9Q9APE3_9PEZI|nr:hypothetical protein Slin14017_G028780 [Septoria linicola]USW49656.1 hypothetical protein Slin15195_G029750 [Septoria linicola]